MNKKSWIIPESAAGERIDSNIARETELSRAAVQGLIQSGMVFLQGKPADKNTRLRGGEEVEITLPDPVAYTAEAEDIPLDIEYEDNDLLVVNKPKGMVVHPAAGNYTGTLVNALLYHCGDSLSGINGVLRPGIVHRIDKDTSGLLLVAKNDRAHQGLAEQIQAHSLTRLYETVVIGAPKEDAGTINAPIGRHPIHRKKMTVIAQNSKNAVTHYEVLAHYAGYTHLRCKLETGRTHQIRVHMAYTGHPVVGDAVYGPSKFSKELQGQCLHARTVGFIHPITGEYLEFTSELPAYFTDFLKKLTPKD
ncbi:MAG: RluA family pseudouridine synthase [Clostridia bacterium]|nr:RluA family pseudouridine synthase [Clostridia bacterium]